jgi:hypothetical protein
VTGFIQDNPLTTGETWEKMEKKKTERRSLENKKDMEKNCST